MNKDQEDFILFEANTLEEAYKKATIAFDCSLTKLKSEVLQTSSNGFFGLFKKNVIIKVYSCKDEKKESKETPSYKANIQIKDVTSSLKTPIEDNTDNTIIPKSTHKKEEIFDSFYEQKNTISNQNDNVIFEIKEKVSELFSYLCYDLNEIEVSQYDEKTVYISFSGKDSALLIGKEGFRYKALSYILFNWIYDKYDLMLRLEIEQFLQNQEESVNKYLVKVIEKINIDGYYKTKTFDGILLHIALNSLREEFPNKYVAIKTNKNNEKYIIVNEYNKNDKQ